MAKKRNNVFNKVVTVILCVLIVLALVFSFAAPAFADFSADSIKVLGVGRIQSATTSRIYVPEQKISVPTLPDVQQPAEAPAQLAMPIERAVVIDMPEAPILSAPSQDAAAPGAAALATSDWQSGDATAYGPLPGADHTANGGVLTEESMGVAVPVEWRYLLGSKIEIEYNGIVVVATATDCGQFLRYGRVLDLQPGVYKAFGVQTAHEWGVRNVRWRVVG